MLRLRLEQISGVTTVVTTLVEVISCLLQEPRRLTDTSGRPYWPKEGCVMERSNHVAWCRASSMPRPSPTATRGLARSKRCFRPGIVVQCSGRASLISRRHRVARTYGTLISVKRVAGHRRKLLRRRCRHLRDPCDAADKGLGATSTVCMPSRARYQRTICSSCASTSPGLWSCFTGHRTSRPG